MEFAVGGTRKLDVVQRETRSYVFWQKKLYMWVGNVMDGCMNNTTLAYTPVLSRILVCCTTLISYTMVTCRYLKRPFEVNWECKLDTRNSWGFDKRKSRIVEFSRKISFIFHYLNTYLLWCKKSSYFKTVPYNMTLKQFLKYHQMIRKLYIKMVGSNTMLFIVHIASNYFHLHFSKHAHIYN